jgi:hypothetical protein
MPHKASAQRSGKAPVPSSIDYPTERAQRAAQRIYKACGLWPAEFARGFGPESWSVQLTTELSVLIQLTVAARNVQLEDVQQRLKTLTAKHIRADHQRLLRSDIAKVRDWLRDSKGVDTKRPRPSTGNLVRRDLIDDEEDDEDDANETEEELEIVAKGIEVDGGEYDEDDDLTEEQESEMSAEEHNTPNERRETHEISSDDDDDDDIAEIVPLATASLTKPNGHFRVSSNNVNATPSPATREPYTTATFAKPSSSGSNAASNTALHPKPNRNVVLSKSHSATQASPGSASPTSSKVTPSSPNAAAISSRTPRAPASMPRNNSAGSTATPSNAAAPSPQTSAKPRGVISAHVGRLDRRPGTNLAGPRTPVESLQSTVASAVGPSSQVNNGTSGSQPTSTNAVQTSTKSSTLLTRPGGTPRTMPSSPNTASNNAVLSNPNVPSSLTRPNGPPKTNLASSSLIPSTAAQPTPTTPAHIVRPNSQARSTLSTTPSLSTQPSPKRGGILSPTQAANETRVANTKPASNTIVQPKPAIRPVVTQAIAKFRVAPSNAISQTSSASSNIAPNSAVQPKAATAPSLIRPNSQSTASPSHSDQGPISIVQPVSDTALTIARSNSQPEINPSNAPSTPTISRPRRNIQPPIRRIYDTPQSSVRLSEAGQSRKRPAESPTQVSPKTPNPPLPQPTTATATTTSNVSTPQTNIVPAVAPSSQTAPSHNNQSRNLIAGSHTNTGMNPPAKRQKITDTGAPRPLAGAALDWSSMLVSKPISRRIRYPLLIS